MLNILVAALMVGAAMLLWLLSGRRIEDGGMLLVGLLALAGSWAILFVWVAGMTEGWLVPWDTTAVRPAVGTWQRGLNDFFEGPPGSVIPSWTVLGLSVGIFIVRFARHRERRWHPWAFAALNVAFVAASSIGSILAWRLPAIGALRAAGVANDLGYQHTAAPLALMLVLLTALLLAQSLIYVGVRQQLLDVHSHP